jgi:predicted acylesterase/phospholipase RssA
VGRWRQKVHPIRDIAGWAAHLTVTAGLSAGTGLPRAANLTRAANLARAISLTVAASLTVLCAIGLPLLPASPFGSGAAYAQGKNAKGQPKQQQPQLTRTPFTPEDQAAAAIPGIPDARVWGDSDDDFKTLLPTSTGPWLALSGGGADGAFGAGVLLGWSASGKRPDFAMVTGASIGSLIGAYAFLGARMDGELKANFTDLTAADIFEDRATPESFLDTWPLKRLLEKRVTPEMLAAIAEEHRKGRRFLVATTNMDAGRRVLWNMGAIAASGHPQALKLFRDVLLASSSIPGFFQPVLIDVEANGKKFQEMHLDGTITAPFFVAPEATIGSNAPFPTRDVFVIVNSKLTSDFWPTDRKLNAILGRTIGVGLTTGLTAELQLMKGVAPRLGINLNIAHVPTAFKEVNRGLFDQKYMEALFKYGADEAAKGTAFESSAKLPAKPGDGAN